MKRFAAFALIGCFLGASAQADVTFDFAQGDLAASAVFNVSGGTLTVTLKNTATVDVHAPGDVLTGLFFDINGFVGSLTRITANLSNPVPAPNGSVLYGNGLGDLGVGYYTTGSGGHVGAEVGYRTGASNPILGGQVGIGDHAIGHVGMDDFMGQDTRFDTVRNLQWAPSPNGIEYGIVNSLYNGGGNAPLDGPNALITTWMVYTFTGFSGSEANIGNVAFNYGTEFNPIPAPGAALLGLIGLGLVSAAKRRFS